MGEHTRRHARPGLRHAQNPGLVEKRLERDGGAAGARRAAAGRVEQDVDEEVQSVGLHERHEARRARHEVDLVNPLKHCGGPGAQRARWRGECARRSRLVGPQPQPARLCVRERRRASSARHT